MFRILVLILSISYTTFGLECYETFDIRTNSCTTNDRHSFSHTPEECCKSSKAVAYSEEIPRENKTVKCSSCKSIRNHYNAIFCFHHVFWLGQRSCHILHPELALSVYECCVHRREFNNSAGFSLEKKIIDSSKGIHECIPCSEAIFNATEWTPWTPCDASCGGGYKTRSKICRTDKIYPPYAVCIGKKNETINCNDFPCKNLTSITTISLILVIVVMTLITIALIICYFRKKRNLASNTKPPIQNLVVDYRSSQIPNAEIGINRYQSTPHKRDLPIIPTENESSQVQSALPSKHDTDIHTYSDVQSTEDENDGYLTMTVRNNV